MTKESPAIMINGFYGAGNSGDEAMLRNFVFHMNRRLENATFFVATEKSALWRQSKVYYISPMDRSRLNLCDLLVVGGGDLGVGFGWQLLSFAKAATEVKTANIGISINNTWTNPKILKAVQAMLSTYDLICVRDQHSKENLNSIDINCKAMTDMAIDLPPIEYEFLHKQKQVCLVIREVAQIHKQQQIELAEKVVELLTKDYFLTILPFSPEDAAFSKELRSIKSTNSQLIMTNDPQHHKYIISNSKYLVSLGRFHPLVYAMEYAVPMLGVTYPEIYLYSKIDAWMQHVDLHDCCMNFVGPFEYFEKKWERLQNQRENYRSRIKKEYAHMVSLNKQQFDELTKLILCE